MSTTTNTVKQRKLNDLRVVDLQRELRSFNIPCDKKELKGSLVEKLRQALIQRNLDPDNHLFDVFTDLKPTSSEEINRSHEENTAHETNTSETLHMEVDSKQHSNVENPVQTTAPTSSLLTNDNEDERNDSKDHMDTNNTESTTQQSDNNTEFSTMEQSTTKQDDENHNDKIDQDLIQLNCSYSDEESNTNDPIQEPSNINFSRQNTESIITTATMSDQETSLDRKFGEDEHQTNLSTNDNDGLSKSESIRPEPSDQQQKKETTNKSNKDDCFLWVSNIAKETHASDLKELFSKYGKVLTTKVIGSSSSQWFGYIQLASKDDVEKCIQALHQTELHGKKIYVDREMHDPTMDSSSSKSKSNNSSTSSHRRTSSYSQKKHSDQTTIRETYKNRDSISNNQDKSSTIDNNVSSSRKRSASTSIENKKKFATSNVNKSNNDEKNNKSYETDSSNKKPNEYFDEKRRNSSSSNNSQSSKHPTSRTDGPNTNEKLESSNKSTTYDRKNDKQPIRSEKSSVHSFRSTKPSTSPSIQYRSNSSEKRNMSSAKSDNHRSSSIDKSKQYGSSSHMMSNKYDKPKESYPKDNNHLHPTSSKTIENDRHSSYQNEGRLQHEKEILVRKHYAQQQEEEHIKEQQRRLAEERARVRREFEILERERLEVERTRLALEKEKQEQARELEKQQRRLADEAKHRQQQVETKLRDEKLHRLSLNDNKRGRSSHHEPQRSHHSSTNNSSNSNKTYDHRSSTNTTSGRGRDRSLNDTSRDYYPEPKRPYTNNQREGAFHDRAPYRDSDLPPSNSGLGLSSSSSMSSNNNNQRYASTSSNQRRLSDPYNALPQRGRDMALPPTSSINTVYERSSRNNSPPPTNSNAILRRPHSRERFDDRDYIQQTSRRDRSPPSNNALRRDSIETSHWERPKPRDSASYSDDTHKYLPTYLSESPQTTQQQQQQGLWSAAPPSRQQHHHADLPVKVDPYGWQHVSHQVPPPSLPSHHPQGLSSSHERTRSNVASNQRIPILPSSQPPPPPPPSSRGSTTSQTHLYGHPGVPVSALAASQQHATLAPPPSALHHTSAYVTQTVPPTGLVLHPTGQPRAYEQHYVVTQPLSQRRY